MNTGRIATVGFFDGIHQGHRWLLQQLVRQAATRGLKPLILTFENHPAALLGRKSPALLMTAPCRKEALEAIVPDADVRFLDADVLKLSAEDFCRHLRSMGVEALMMGFNNHIGCNRCKVQDIAFKGMDFIEAEPYPATAVSSTMVRAAVASGDFDGAATLLGHRYILRGTVEKGKQLGRTIGFPTANMDISYGPAIPPKGVYAAFAGVDGLSQLPAVVNVGSRPTVDGDDAPVTVEVHLLNYSGPSLYGKIMSLDFVAQIRSERKFPSLDDLKKQIAADCTSAKKILTEITERQ